MGLLITGAVVAAIAIFIGLALARRMGWLAIAPIAGFVLALPLAVVTTDAQPQAMWGLAGLVALVVTGRVVPDSLAPALKGLASLPGAVLLSITQPLGTGAIIVLGVPLLVAAVARFEDGHDYEHGLSAICAAVAGGGAFLTVPDTEHTALLAGAGVIVGVLVIAQPGVTLGSSMFVWAGAFLWAVAIDGEPRTTGLIGAIGALGLLLIDPITRAFVPVVRGLLTYLPTTGDRNQVLAVAGLQTGIALIASRIAGLQESVAVAVVILLVTFIAVSVGLVRLSKGTGVS